MSFSFDFPTNIDAFKAMLFTSKVNISAQNSTLTDHIADIERKIGRIIQLEHFLTDFIRGLYKSKFRKGQPDQYNLEL